MTGTEPTRLTHVLFWLALGFVFCVPISLMGMQVLGIAGFLVAAGLLYQRRGPLVPLDLAVGGYLLAVLASWLPVAGLPLDPLRMSGIWPVLAYGMFRVAGEGLARGEAWRRVWLGSAVFVGIYVCIQHVTGFDLLAPDGSRLYPSPANPERMAVFGFFARHHTFGISAALSLAVLALSRPMGLRFLPGGLWLLAPGLGLLLSQSRAAFFAAVTALLLGAALRKGGALLWGGLALLGLAFALAAGAEPALAGRLMRIWDASHDASRAAIWQVAASLGGSLGNGVGFGRFFLQSQTFFDLLKSYVWVRSGTHLELLSAWVEGGPLLAAAWAGLWTTLGLTVWRLRENPTAVGVGSGLWVLWVAGFAHNVMVDGELSWPMWALLGFLGALDAGRCRPLRCAIQKT